MDPRNDNKSRAQVITRLLVGEEVDWRRLDDMRAELAAEIFGGNGWSAPPEAAGDPRVNDVLDLFHATELIDLQEPAFAWNRAGLLCDLVMFVEGAEAFLEAARRLDAGIASGLVESDEAEWADAARAHASQAFVLAGHLTSATVVWQQLRDADYRDDLQEVIEGALRDPSTAQEPVNWIPHPRWQDLRT